MKSKLFRLFLVWPLLPTCTLNSSVRPPTQPTKLCLKIHLWALCHMKTQCDHLQTGAKALTKNPTLILHFSASKTVRNKCLLFKPKKHSNKIKIHLQYLSLISQSTFTLPISHEWLNVNTLDCAVLCSIWKIFFLPKNCQQIYLEHT